MCLPKGEQQLADMFTICKTHSYVSPSKERSTLSLKLQIRQRQLRKAMCSRHIQVFLILPLRWHPSLYHVLAFCDNKRPLQRISVLQKTSALCCSFNDVCNPGFCTIPKLPVMFPVNESCNIYLLYRKICLPRHIMATEQAHR